MSSHHIVKEKQEPALYIHTLGNFGEEALGQLLEWSPFILVRGAEFEKIASLNIKIDLIAGHIPPALLQEHSTLLEVPSEDPYPVMQYLVDEEYPAVNIISDTVDTSVLAAFAEKINIVWFTAAEKTYQIKSGFSVWKPKGSTFRIAGKINPMLNLRHIKSDTYEVIADGFVTFKFDADNMCISERL